MRKIARLLCQLTHINGSKGMCSSLEARSRRIRRRNGRIVTTVKEQDRAARCSISRVAIATSAAGCGYRASPHSDPVCALKGRSRHICARLEYTSVELHPITYRPTRMPIGSGDASRRRNAMAIEKEIVDELHTDVDSKAVFSYAGLLLEILKALCTVAAAAPGLRHCAGTY